MTTYPISVQLYSLRDYTKDDLPGVLQRLGRIGFAAVEPAGFFGYSPTEVRAMAEDAGMRVLSSHSPWANGNPLEDVVATARAFDLDIVGGGYGRAAFADMAAIERTCAEVSELCAQLAKHDLKLFLHNHAWEFARFDGRWGMEILAERVPDVLFEVDTYWAANFGANDAQAVVQQFASRAPLLHIKDGSLVEGEANCRFGRGRMDIPGVIAAADPQVLRALVVEFDACVTDDDLWQAVEASFQYLVDQGLGHGQS